MLITYSVMCSQNRLQGITSHIKNLLSPPTNKTPVWQFKGRSQWYTFNNTVKLFLWLFTNAQCFFSMLTRTLNLFNVYIDYTRQFSKILDSGLVVFCIMTVKLYSIFDLLCLCLNHKLEIIICTFCDSKRLMAVIKTASEGFSIIIFLIKWLTFSEKFLLCTFHVQSTTLSK